MYVEEAFFLHQATQAAARANVRIVTEAGSLGHVGLLEIETKEHGYGTVCGMNGHSADVACRQLGYDYGAVSPHSCGQYGGTSMCGASGSFVALKDLRCTGKEVSIDECEFDEVDDGCLSHSSDSVVYCGLDGQSAFADGEFRLISPSGAPALPQEAGRLEMFLVAANAWAPVCVEGFSGGSANRGLQSYGLQRGRWILSMRQESMRRKSRRIVGSLACSGSESNVMQCSMATGDLGPSVRPKSLLF